MPKRKFDPPNDYPIRLAVPVSDGREIRRQAAAAGVSMAAYVRAIVLDATRGRKGKR